MDLVKEDWRLWYFYPPSLLSYSFAVFFFAQLTTWDNKIDAPVTTM